LEILFENKTKSCLPLLVLDLITWVRGRRSNIAFITKKVANVLPKKWNSNIFLQRKLFQRKNAKNSQTNF